MLGMGMPTLGVYVLLAVLIAPALVEVGVTPLAAHMFILYLGMMSFVTPPVAIAAFFAANLAKADPMKTGWAAMRFSWTAYIVPFLFVFSPTLLDAEPLVGVDPAVGLDGHRRRVVRLGRHDRLRPAGACRPRAAAGRRSVGGFLLLLPPEMADWAWIANVVGLRARGIARWSANISAAGRRPARSNVAAE